jgi:uncharacterized membrane protein
MIDDFDKLSVTELRQRGMTSDKILAEQKRRGMSKQQINDAWYPKPPTYNRIESRRFRRRLVLATYGGWLLAAAIFLLASMIYPRSLPAYELPFLLVANGIVLGVWFFRKTYISREVLSTDSGLDERLVQNRNHAFRRAFQIFAPLVLLAWALSIAVMAAQPGNPGHTSALVIYFAVILLATTLPTAIWAWREPDPLTTEEGPP